MRNPDRARIVVDASPLRYLYTGLGQFSYHLLEEFGKAPLDDAELVALVHPRFADRLPPGVPAEPATWLRRHAPPFLQQYLYPPCPVWHMTTENTRLTGIPRNTKLVLTIHGLHFLDESPGDVATKELAHVQTLVDRAQVITVVSKFTEKLVRDKLNAGNRLIEVIPNGIALAGVRSRKPGWAPVGRFLLAIGTFFARKNFHILVPMMKRLPEFHLVIAGDAIRDYGRIVRSAVEAEGLQARILLPGEIGEEEKEWLYENASAYLFPSVSEGFGIPIIESFHHGIPVFCSRYGSLPEVGSTHAFYWDAFDPEPMADLIQSRLQAETPGLRTARAAYAAEFTWKRTADCYRKIYRALL